MVEWLDRQPRNRYTRVPHVLFKSLPHMLVSDTAEIVTSFKLKNRLTKFTAWPQSESRKKLLSWLLLRNYAGCPNFISLVWGLPWLQSLERSTFMGLNRICNRFRIIPSWWTYKSSIQFTSKLNIVFVEEWIVTLRMPWKNRLGVTKQAFRNASLNSFS